MSNPRLTGLDVIVSVAITAVSTTAGYASYAVVFRHVAPGRLWFVLTLLTVASVATVLTDYYWYKRTER